MTLRDNLLKATRRVLSTLGPTSTDLSGGSARTRKARTDVVYEACVFMQVVAAAARTGHAVTAVPAQSTFRVRRGPGEFWSAEAESSYVKVESQAKSFEMHLDTYVQTRSQNAKLELDILAVSGSHARSRRLKKERPSFRCVRLLVEVKCLAGKAGTSEAKEFIGIADRVKCKRCLALFVSATKLTENARNLIHGGKPMLYGHERVLPISSCRKALSDFVTFLDNQLPLAFS